MNDKAKLGITTQLNRCIELYSSGVLYTDSIFTQSAFIELLVRLNDILMYLAKKNLRISFTADVSGKKIADITDIVMELRNAACHERTSGESNYETNRFTFCRFLGGAKMKIGKVIFGSDYPDDVAFFYGDKRLYVNRHIKQLLDEVSEKIKKI